VRLSAAVAPKSLEASRMLCSGGFERMDQMTLEYAKGGARSFTNDTISLAKSYLMFKFRP
jgi:hypothetical protein